MSRFLALSLFSCLLFAVEPPPAAANAEATTPIAIGTAMPSMALRNADGVEVELATTWAEQPVVLVVYRGSWCPFCVRQLAALHDVADALTAAGWKLVAISPDKPEKLAPPEPDGIFRLSDQDALLSRSLGLAFRVDAATVTQYREYGIDLNEASGRDHHILPVPAVLLIDTTGVIRFIHADPDYRQRLDPVLVLTAAKDVPLTP